MSYPNRWQAAVTFEFWDTMKVYHRIDYGLLDWLSDIGGLFNILNLSFFILIKNYLEKGTSYFVASELISKQIIEVQDSEQDDNASFEDQQAV